jgi:hypothetical protein
MKIVVRQGRFVEKLVRLALKNSQNPLFLFGPCGRRDAEVLQVS